MFNILQKFSNIIKRTEVKTYEFEENQVRIKIELILTDGSTLTVKDYRFSNNKRKYSYHWMDDRGNLKIRWDNAPHWKSISTYPHHRHIWYEDNVDFSIETDIESVLDCIKKVLKNQLSKGT